jgi:acetyl-CoA carboxylase carboxyltransferase component
MEVLMRWMNSKHIGADRNFAWLTAEIAVMGAKCFGNYFQKGNYRS